jgi:cell division protein FtsQ
VTGTMRHPPRTATRPAPPIDPRIRERRNAVARHRGRRRLRALAAVGAVVLGLVLLDVGLHSSLLSVTHIGVQGTHEEPVAAVVKAAGVARHRPLFGLDEAAVEADVDALPWIASSRVQRHWPHTIVVTVTERVPVAQVAVAGGHWAEVDGSGRVLAVGETRHTGLPRLAVAAPTAAVLNAGTRLPAADRPALAAAAALPDLPPQRLNEVEAVTVKAGTGVDLTLSDGATVLLGPPTDLSTKLAALATVVSEVDMSGVRTIDLRVPGQPALTRA